MGIVFTKKYEKDFTAEPKHRKHFILLDGTWNDETGENLDGLVTNIVNMRRILKDDKENQIVRYHRGVGNDDDNSLFGNIWGGATGYGVKKIVDTAYVRFVKDWRCGDEIFIFGFSRGAAAARLLAKKIHDNGVPKSIEISIVPKANKQTKVVEQVISSFKLDTSSAPHKVDICFLGVWDTVSAFGLYNNIKRFLGLKRKDLFTDHHIAGNIKKAVHLVALDETRNPFIPSLMNHIPKVTHEVWFPGVHSDIGGSYAEDEIAKISLFYMFKMMRKWIKKREFPPLLISEENFLKYSRPKSEKAHFHFHGDAVGEDLRMIGVQVAGKIDENLAPKIHLSYQDFCRSHATYSVVDQDDEKKYVRFQYMPFNVKLLEKRYEIVE